MRSKIFTWVTCSVLLAILIFKGCDMMEPKMPVTKTDFPTGNITMIVPFGVGGGTDLQARALEKMFPKYLNKGLVVTNKPGAGGMIGWNDLAMAQPDGYTIGMTASELLIQPICGDTKYHYPTALDPLVQLISTPYILVVNADQPWNTVNDLIEYAKQNPNNFKYGHSGTGSISQVLSESFSYLVGVKPEQVPFKSGSESLAALLGNHIQFNFADPSVVKEQIRTGRLKALASTGEQRFTDIDLSHIPTLQESDIDLSLSIWTGVAVPQMVPPAVKAKLSEALEKMAVDPEFKATLDKLGVQLDYLNAEQSKKKWAKELNQLNKMLKDTGIAEQIKAQRK